MTAHSLASFGNNTMVAMTTPQPPVKQQARFREARLRHCSGALRICSPNHQCTSHRSQLAEHHKSFQQMYSHEPSNPPLKLTKP